MSYTARAVFLSVAALTLAFVGTRVASYFPIWLLGAGVNLLPPLAQRGRRLLVIASASMIFALLALSAVGRLADGYRLDALVAVGASILLYGLRFGANPTSIIYNRLARGLASGSYTLYLVHYPALLFLSRVLLGGQRRQANATGLFVICSVVVGIAIYSWLVWRFTEARTYKVRAFLVRCFFSQESPAQPPPSRPTVSEPR
jgi:peptidoglycan/LPS O-acetylase OafA/YrhL